MEEVIKKQSGTATKRKDYGKTRMTQMIGSIRPMLTEHFSRIKLSLNLSLRLLEFKVIILRLLLTLRPWRVVLVFPHSISVSVIINYTYMGSEAGLCKAGPFKAENTFLLNLDIEEKTSVVLASFKKIS